MEAYRKFVLFLDLGYLFTALRRAINEELIKQGFQPISVGHQGVQNNTHPSEHLDSRLSSSATRNGDSPVFPFDLSTDPDEDSHGLYFGNPEPSMCGLQFFFFRRHVS